MGGSRTGLDRTKSEFNIPEHIPNRNTLALPTTLSVILETTRRGLEPLRRRRSELEAAARKAPPPPRWSDAFGGPAVAVIAEVKRRSPSAGVIAPGLSPAAHASAYAAGGARAISVLTDGPHFGGSLEDLAAVRQEVALPVLRKDFMLDPVQLYESRAAGASAVLLIVRALDAGLMRELSSLALELGLGRLVEVHDRRELDLALAVDPEVVGVNSRDLDSFSVDVAAMGAVLSAVPSSVVAVAESGLGSRDDVERVAGWGADAVLVGSTLASAPDPAAAVRALVGVRRCRRHDRADGDDPGRTADSRDASGL